MAIELITGRAGTPHVDSADVGAFNASLFGEGAYILEGINAELVDANNVNVSAGELLCEGRHIRITGAGETLTIDNGLSAYKRHDIIAAHYLRDEDGLESVQLLVIKGEADIDTPTDPEMPTAGKLIDGASDVYWPLYRIVIDGLTPQTPVAIAGRQAWYTLGLGEEIPAGADLNDYVEPGIYYANGATVSNNPAQSNYFSLIVEKTSGNTRQTLHPTFWDYGQYDNAETEWVRYISGLGVPGKWACSGGVDSIIAESIGQGGWNWVKYASGLAELWYPGAYLGDCDTGWGSLWRGVQHDFYYPFPLSQFYFVSVSADMWDGWTSCWGNESAFYAVPFSSSQHPNVTGNVHIVGRWK